MNLLDKFTTVKVDNTKRLPKEDFEYIENLHNDYTNVLDLNFKLLESLEPLHEELSEQRKPKQGYYTYIANTDDMLKSIKKEISNVNYIFISSCISYINKKYNTDIEADKDFKIGEKLLGKLYVHKWHDYWRTPSESFTWDDIKVLRFTTQDIIDFVYKQVDSMSLDDVAINESKEYMVNWSKSDHVDPIVIAKNGTVTFDYFLVNPSSSYNDKSSIKTLTSLITCLSRYCDSIGSKLDEKIDIDVLKKYFEIGTYYNSWNSNGTKMYDKYETDGVVKSIQQFKNNKMKIKFQNATHAYGFLDFVGINYLKN